MFYADVQYDNYSDGQLTSEGLSNGFRGVDYARFETLEACRDELRLASMGVTATEAMYTIYRDTDDTSELVESGKIADLIAD